MQNSELVHTYILPNFLDNTQKGALITCVNSLPEKIPTVHLFVIEVNSDSMILKILPFLGLFKGCTTTKFKIDFLAGLTVALGLIPQSMAYAQLAGLPAYYGFLLPFCRR